MKIHGVNDKRNTTADFCGSLTGYFIRIQIIYKGKTNRFHPKFQFPPGRHITHAPKQWSTEQTMVQYIEEVILPFVEAQRTDLEGSKPALAIMDNFRGQTTSKVTDLLEANGIYVCFLPANTTDLLKPMDISVNNPAKRLFEEEI